jgi:hypothetical protein
LPTPFSATSSLMLSQTPGIIVAFCRAEYLYESLSSEL